MGRKIGTIFLLGFFVAVLGCQHKHDEEKTGTVYTCPMHPEIKKYKPGSCPICGMDLVPVVSENTKNELASNIPLDKHIHTGGGIVYSSAPTISPTLASTIYTQKVEGYITYDTRNIINMAAKFSGRIEKLYVKYAYQPIQQGQKVFELYSPDLVTDLHHLVTLSQNKNEDQRLLDALKKKLITYGLDEAQLQEFISKGNHTDFITVYAPASGHIHNPGGSLDGLEKQMGSGSEAFVLKEGMYLEKGKTILTILPTHSVWAIFKIPIALATSIKVGQKILFHHPEHGDWEAPIAQILPFIPSSSKYVLARVNVPNHHHRYNIGEYVDGTLEIQRSSSRLSLPAAAVYVTGNHTYVFKKTNNAFKIHEISAFKMGSNYTITHGLTIKDTVLASAGLVMDPESIIIPDSHE